MILNSYGMAGTYSELRPDKTANKKGQILHVGQKLFAVSYRRGFSPLIFINSATMLTAISAGVSELILSPMGA